MTAFSRLAPAVSVLAVAGARRLRLSSRVIRLHCALLLTSDMSAGGLGAGRIVLHLPATVPWRQSKQHLAHVLGATP